MLFFLGNCMCNNSYKRIYSLMTSIQVKYYDIILMVYGYKFQVVERILYVYAKLNPGLGYVQVRKCFTTFDTILIKT